MIGRLVLGHLSNKIGKGKSVISLYCIICILLGGMWKVQSLGGICVLRLVGRENIKRQFANM